MAAQQRLIDAPLSMQMLRASKTGHAKTDRAVNLRLIGLFADRKIYAGAIGCFYYILKEIETQLEQHASSDPRLAKYVAVARPLYRASAFKQDLCFYFGHDQWEQELRRRSLFPAVQAYLDHLKALAGSQPLLLAAHSFTQHLAVASGGQIISKLVKKGLALSQNQSQQQELVGEGEEDEEEYKHCDGVSAFYFGAGVNPKDLKAALKECIDSLGDSELTEDEELGMIEEHKRAFEYNQGIITGYQVGWQAPFVGAMKLATRSRAVGAVMAALIVAVSVFGWAIWKYSFSD